ncbi:LuxR family transcriptional regulator [Herbiconiux sp. CPCC 205763]|uniref:LuxR family transcriptional regulator n=1 Tax=Herbiconiux aconitum TaxID=2970913 RepID=A0ABT2GNB5_9MICO|nr:LuxR family transcriptional regulator [Herbiconiux aconitum]MCS5717719.1 LuxR family transcriptional regulator [Herbiconiux aconitum]
MRTDFTGLDGTELTELLGRHAEREAVQHLLAEAQAGRSGTVVVRGEAGIGKSALLDDLRISALRGGFQVAAICGVESETQFAFAALHQLVASMLDRAVALPDPQQAALSVALGLRSGDAPDRFLVGLATLNLLAEVAEEWPLLCLVDDAQWLDIASAQVLVFVARRIAAEGVALVFARRDPGPGEVDVFATLEPELPLTGLGEADARTLLADGIRTPLDDHVRDRILAEARGNPLALLELPRSAVATQLAGGFELPDVRSIPRRIEETFRLRSAGLAASAQSLLLLAAAEPTGDAELLWRAADRLGLNRETAGQTEASGLVEIDSSVRFRHPLVRSAVYRAATAAARRDTHRALADATDPIADPDRRAWHRAQAVLGTDEEAAAELERTAERTRARGGVAAAAAFLQHAAELTADPAARARRALAAAHAKHDAGASEAAAQLAKEAEAGPLTELERARLELLRARIAFQLTQGDKVPRMLLDAAATLAPLDAALARETYLHALDAAMIIGAPDHLRSVQDVAQAARAAPSPPDPPRPADLLLDGLVAMYTRGYVEGAPALLRALEAFIERGFDGQALGQMGSRRWLWLATRAGSGIFDAERSGVLSNRNVALAREAGALATLPGALAGRAGRHVITGEIPQAIELIAESEAITAATGAAPLRHARFILHAWRGQEADAKELFEATARHSAASSEGAEAAAGYYARAVLRNGFGSYSDAMDAATRASEMGELSMSALALPELVEAAVRAGRPDRATAASEELGARARASGCDWGLGLAARSRALTGSSGNNAAIDDDYREAIRRLDACGMGGHLARTHLVYGEWLRREGSRQAARFELRTAHDLLATMGMEAFAARAARELRATGENPRKRNSQPATALTDHELQIARLVATGATSREVAAQLFLSPRTIEAHLRNIFRKLDISSRRQLRDLKLP